MYIKTEDKMDLILAYVPDGMLEVMDFDEAYEYALEMDRKAVQQLLASVPDNYQLRLNLGLPL